MSSTQDSDGNFQSWFAGSRWKAALYIGLPLLGVGVMGVILWRRHSAEDTSELQSEIQDDITTVNPPQELVGNFLYMLISEKM